MTNVTRAVTRKFQKIPVYRNRHHRVTWAEKFKIDIRHAARCLRGQFDIRAVHAKVTFQFATSHVITQEIGRGTTMKSSERWIRRICLMQSATHYLTK